MLKQLRRLARERPWAKDDEDVERAITYFANQSGAGRMDYSSRVAANEPIGSGVTEAACKVIVKQRLCGSGMKWSEDGAEVVLSLRALIGGFHSQANGQDRTGRELIPISEQLQKATDRARERLEQASQLAETLRDHVKSQKSEIKKKKSG